MKFCFLQFSAYYGLIFMNLPGNWNIQGQPPTNPKSVLTFYMTFGVNYFLNPYGVGGLFGQYKMMQKTYKMTETLVHGYLSESTQKELSESTQKELSNEYQHDRV